LNELEKRNSYGKRKLWRRILAAAILIKKFIPLNEK
jgi:hypothetical protein